MVYHKRAHSGRLFDRSRKDVIRRGELGRGRVAMGLDSRHLDGRLSYGRRWGAAGGMEGPESVAAQAEAREWAERFGRDWVEGLRSLARWTAEVGIPVRAGSWGLATSELGHGWGWGGLPGSIGKSHREERPSRTTWILRVPPGWGERMRSRLAEDGRLAPRGGRPVLVVEESITAHLPGEPFATGWPSREAWCRAERLLGFSVDASRGGRALVPEDFANLVSQLECGASGRHPREGDQARLAAWDLWCAASAWDRDRATWWLARTSAGFSSRAEEREWIRRAWDWGLQVLPVSVERSSVCARREGPAIRLGLGDLAEVLRDVSPDLVRDRERGGSYRTVLDFVRRARRRGVAWSALAALAHAGALDELMEPTRAELHRWVVNLAGALGAGALGAGALGPRPVRVPALEWTRLALPPLRGAHGRA